MLFRSPTSIQQSLNNLNQGYSKALFFQVPDINFTGEKNIFLSLSPNKNLSAYNNSADQITDSVKAVIIEYNSLNPSCVTVPNVYNYKFDIDFISRDPNSITTNPSNIFLSWSKKNKNIIIFLLKIEIVIQEIF